MSIEENIKILKEDIRKTALRVNKNPDDIILIAVTKTVNVDRIEEAIKAGISDIGENRIQEAKQKIGLLSSYNIKWHMVGHLQTNKVKEAVKMFHLIHSVDSLRLTNEINKESIKQNKVTSCLLEVNVGEEPTKFGLKCEEVPPFLKNTENLANIKILGLMTVAPVCQDKEDVRPFFKRLKELFDDVNKMNFNNVKMQYLSMGMSADFNIAIEEGANIIRIGTAIFGERFV